MDPVDDVMRIGVIAHLKHAIREPFAGGLEMHTHALCSSLTRRGHEVTLFAAEGSQSREVECISNEMPAGVTSFPDEHRVYLQLMYRLKSARFDILHNNSLHYLPIAAASSLPMPMITTLHTPPFWELEGAMRLSNAPHHCFVAVSDFVRRSWQPINGVDNVIANGIDVTRFVFRAEPDPEPYAIWYGRIVPEKGLHLAIDAARAADIPLRVAGPIADHAYFDRIVRPRMTSAIRYLGHLAHDALADAIAGARVFICTPLWDEPYGLVAAESLSCGTPVAAFARGALPALLDATCGVLAAPGSVKSLTDATRSAQHLSRSACRQHAEVLCDSSKMIDAYERLYQQMKKGPERPTVRMSMPGDVQSILPQRQALIDLYRRRVPLMMCELPASAPLPCPA